MILKYILKENDFLQAQLYHISKNEMLASNRIKSSIYYPIIFIIVSLITFIGGNISLSLFFSSLAVILFFVTYVKIKNIYFKDAIKVVKTSYKERFNKEVVLTIEDEKVIVEDSRGKSIINVIECKEIIETKKYFYIKMNLAYIILPKDRLENIDIVTEELVKISATLKIFFTNDFNWKW